MPPDDKKDEKPDDKKDQAPDLAKQLADMQATNKLMADRLEKLEGKGNGGKKKDADDDSEDDDLNDKARKTREADDKNRNNQKALESALKFSLKSEEFLKTNQSLLPKDIGDIFKAAEKEKYESAIEKDAAIKSGLIQSFFAIQANLDLLTPALKSKLEEYLKLTNTGKQDRAQETYENIFEPAFEMLRRLKKAEALNKGLGENSDSDTAYKSKLMTGSRKHYLGEKANA